MWLGESKHSLDNKNRLFLPKRFQEGLERGAEGNLTAILTRGFEGCLFLFSTRGFQGVLERLNTQAFEGADARLMQRLFFSSSTALELDSACRLLVPEKLKSLVGIDKEVVMIGVIDRIEVWPAETWAALEAKHGNDFDRLDRVICGDTPRASARNQDG
jgi:MraZ protein